MKKKDRLNRRKAILAMGTVGGFLFTGCKTKSPPTYGNILRMGDALTYVAQRTLLPGQSLAKEYDRSAVCSFPATGTTNPADASKPTHSKEYAAHFESEFKNWSLSVEGSVSKPGNYSLDQLKQFPSRTQITKHTCEEGWSAIAEWTGVPLAEILQHAGIKPTARFVNFYAYDGYIDSIDLLDAFHPQTILAYEMNGSNLPVPHGAPLRVRVEKQIGYKSVKYLQRIVVTDAFVDPGDSGWSWYVGL